MKQYLQLINLINGLNRYNLVAVYNEQVERALNGVQTLPLLSCFIEIIKENEVNLGDRVVGCDLSIRIHICQSQLDSGMGLLDENLTIFELRDEINDLITGQKLDFCSLIQPTGQIQSYKHGHIYHFVKWYKCHFIDISAYKETILDGGWVIWNENSLIFHQDLQTWDNSYNLVLDAQFFD